MRNLELLTKSHDRSGFDCGSKPLNAFLRQTARQHAARGISRRFVLVEEDSPLPKPILGFFTLNLCQVTEESLPAVLAKKLPDKVGAVRLGRLAVALACRGRGLGEVLLAEALKKSGEIFLIAGGIGLFVDAKDQTAKRYYEQFGFKSLTPDGLHLFLPSKTIQEALKT